MQKIPNRRVLYVSKYVIRAGKDKSTRARVRYVSAWGASETKDVCTINSDDDRKKDW